MIFVITQTMKTVGQGILKIFIEIPKKEKWLPIIPAGMLALNSRKGNSVMNIKYNRLLIIN